VRILSHVQRTVYYITSPLVADGLGNSGSRLARSSKSSLGAGFPAREEIILVNFASRVAGVVVTTLDSVLPSPGSVLKFPSIKSRIVQPCQVH